MRTMIFLVTVMLLLLSSCATSQPKGAWYRDGATTDDFYRERGQCIVEARANNRTTMLFDPIIFSGCMQGKGWQWRSVQP